METSIITLSGDADLSRINPPVSFTLSGTATVCGDAGDSVLCDFMPEEIEGHVNDGTLSGFSFKMPSFKMPSFKGLKNPFSSRSSGFNPLASFRKSFKIKIPKAAFKLPKISIKPPSKFHARLKLPTIAGPDLATQLRKATETITSPITQMATQTFQTLSDIGSIGPSMLTKGMETVSNLTQALPEVMDNVQDMGMGMMPGMGPMPQQQYIDEPMAQEYYPPGIDPGYIDDGGFGASSYPGVASSYFADEGQAAKGAKKPFPMWIILAAGGGVVLVMMMRKKKGGKK